MTIKPDFAHFELVSWVISDNLGRFIKRIPQEYLSPEFEMVGEFSLVVYLLCVEFQLPL